MSREAVAGVGDELFYADVITRYVGAPGFVARSWLVDEIGKRLRLPSCRYVLLIGEPGSGKTGIMSSLAHDHPEWPRYFMRHDSVAPASGVDPVSVLLRIGHQLAAIHPELFDPQHLEI